MTVKAIQYSSFDFVKDHDEVYFELLRLARITECADDITIDRKAAITVLNQLPLFEKVHKRIIPLLNDKAHKLAIFNDLSAESKNILTACTQQGIVTELAKKQQLNKIIEMLSAHSIPLILLKGAAFSEVLYSSDAPRTSNDLDILIKKEHWHKAVAAIKTVMNYTEKPQPDVFGDLYELSFKPKNKVGAALDLHMGLTYPKLYTVDNDKLWESSIVHPAFGDNKVRMLSPEYALVHQAIHAYKDMDFCKYNLVDSHEIISVETPDVGKVIEIAKEWGASIPIYVLLKNCSDIMSSEFDLDLLKSIKPSFITRYCISQLLRSQFTQPQKNRKPLRYRLNQILSQFIFTGSINRPLALQWLFIKSLVKNIFV